MAFDSTKLVARITLLGSLPDGRFEDQELLDFAFDSLLSEIVPLVLACREDFFVTYKDYAVTSSQSAYAIPYRALNGVLREVKLISGSTVKNLERIDLEEVTSTQEGSPNRFYISGNDVVLYPTPSSTDGQTLRLYYFLRPSKLVTNAECGRITAIDPATNTITVSIPTGWTTSNTFDLVKGKAHFNVVSMDLAASSVSGGAITFTSSLPSTLEIGDYVALSEETCFPFLPAEGHVALIQSAVATALESIGDPNSPVMAAKAEKLKDTFQTVLKTRVVGQPKALGKPLI
jgi:hypothetical protein